MTDKIIKFRGEEEKFVEGTVDALNDIIQKVEAGEFRTFIGICYSPEEGVCMYYSKPQGVSMYELLGFTAIAKDYFVNKTLA